MEENSNFANETNKTMNSFYRRSAHLSPLQQRVVESLKRELSGGIPKTLVSQDLCRTLQKLVQTNPYKRRISETPLRTFGRQNAALDYCKEMNDPSVHVFSFEKHKSKDGRRQYMASPFGEFYHFYKSLPRTQKHYYELIAQDKPCRLYFDVEYYRDIEQNSEIQENELRQTFVEHVCACLADDYQISASNLNCIDLDASSTKKYSRHMIFHLMANMKTGESGSEPTTTKQTELLFENNRVCGEFVKRVVDRIYDACEKDDKCPLGILLVHNKSGTRVPVCDQAVYSRNRIFRLYQSTKADDVYRPLVLADACQFYDPDAPSPLDAQILRDSFVCPLNTVDYVLIEERDDDDQHDSTASHRRQNGQNSKPFTQSSSVSTEPSPHPQIDAFIRGELSRRCDGGYVRAWQYNEDAKLLQYTFGACKNTHNSASAFILSVFTTI